MAPWSPAMLTEAVARCGAVRLGRNAAASSACLAASATGAGHCGCRGVKWGCLGGCWDGGDAWCARAGHGAVSLYGNTRCTEGMRGLAWSLLGTTVLSGPGAKLAR